jgi:GntR family transcriptional regulator, rspAB operon transcriptional repressor
MYTSPILPRLPKTRLNDSVYDVIRKNILSQVFSPGQRLIMDEVAKQLGVSMTPLKDALNRLAVEGLVEIVPRQGTYVTSLQWEDIAETFDVRCALEVMAAELLLVHATDEELHEITAMVDQLDELAKSPDKGAIYQEYVRMDSEMHHRLVELSGNQRLLAAHVREHSHIYIARVRYGSFEASLEQAQKEHRLLKNALLARDVPGVLSILKQHILRAKYSLLNDVRDGVDIAANLST